MGSIRLQDAPSATRPRIRLHFSGLAQLAFTPGFWKSRYSCVIPCRSVICSHQLPRKPPVSAHWDAQSAQMSAVLVALVRGAQGLAGVRLLDWHHCMQVKLWDARSGVHVTTYHGHQDRVNVVKFHWNGNWLLSGGKDAVCKLFELRMNRELQRFVGHTKDITSVVWHPSQEALFSTGEHEFNLHRHCRLSRP
jgi:WD domain, G-beta repeat